jgi:hypothetical protein
VAGEATVPVPGGVDGNLSKTRLAVVPVVWMNATWLPEREKIGDRVTVLAVALPAPVL